MFFIVFLKFLLYVSLVYGRDTGFTATGKQTAGGRPECSLQMRAVAVETKGFIFHGGKTKLVTEIARENTNENFE